MSPPDRLLSLPCWQGPVWAERLSGGLSNESWKVEDAAGLHVARFGPDFPFHHVNRAREVMAGRAAHAAGFGPAVEYDAPGVSVIAWIEGRTLGPAEIRAMPERIGAFLRRFHREMPDHVSGPGFLFWPFHVIRDYARALRAAESPFAPGLTGWWRLAAELEAAQVPLPVIFGHHDLLPANFLDDGARLWLIDYEYAGFGTAMFDLAGAASNAGMEGAEAEALLTASFGAPPGPDLIRAFDAMQCASLLREAMWAMVSDLHMAVPGVDYRAYAAENLAKLDAALDLYRSRHGTPEP